MPTINELKKKALNNAGYSGSISDAEYKWLKDICSPYVGSIPDMWRYALRSAEYFGPLLDAQNKMLSNLGHTGTISNKWYKYWLNTPLEGVDLTAPVGYAFLTDFESNPLYDVNGVRLYGAI